ncbi:MAG: LysM peptidoglycan-binding domain-containing protein [bacterium]
MNKYNYPLMNDYQKMKTYVVQKGDSLYSIAKKFSCNIEELQDVNKLATTMIYPNQVLFIPEYSLDAYVTKQGDTMKMVLDNLGIRLPSLNGYEALLELELSPSQQINTSDGTIVYNGETVEEILMRNNISAQKFIELNKSSWLKSGSRFKVK